MFDRELKYRIIWILEKTLVVQVTVVFIICNLLIAHYPSFGKALLVIRDSWMLTLVLLIFMRGSDRSIFPVVSLLAIVLLIGGLPVVESKISSATLFIYAYGARDVLLIIFVWYTLISKTSLHTSALLVDRTVQVIFFLLLMEILFQFNGLDHVNEAVYRYKEYYDSKGVIINLDGGILGRRPSAPLYSPGLVATTLSIYLLVVRPAAIKFTAILGASFFTISKVVPLVRFYIPLTVTLFSVSSVAVYTANYVKTRFPDSIYSYHAHSISEHLDPLSYLTKEDNTVLPDLLGSSSIGGMVLAGKDPAQAPESMLATKIMDLNWLALFFIGLLGVCTYGIPRQYRFHFTVFLVLSFFTGLSNHPICYTPFILLRRSRSSGKNCNFTRRQPR